MTNLLIGLSLLLFLALAILFWAMRKTTKAKYILLIFFAPIAFAMYNHWGAYQELQILDNKKKSQALAQAVLKHFKGPAEVIKRMEQHLRTPKGNTAKGWYLLGRLYLSQKKFEKSTKAFAKANALDSKDLKIKLSYIESMYIVNGQKSNNKIKKLLNEVLLTDPSQLDALNFIAIDAYSNKDYSKSIAYWQKMLVVLPQGSKEKQAVLDEIVRAKYIDNAKTQQKEIIK